MALRCVFCTKVPANKGVIHIHLNAHGDSGYEGDSFCCLDHLMFWLTSERAASAQKWVDGLKGEEEDDG